MKILAMGQSSSPESLKLTAHDLRAFGAGFAGWMPGNVVPVESMSGDEYRRHFAATLEAIRETRAINAVTAWCESQPEGSSPRGLTYSQRAELARAVIAAMELD